MYNPSVNYTLLQAEQASHGVSVGSSITKKVEGAFENNWERFRNPLVGSVNSSIGGRNQLRSHDRTVAANDKQAFNKNWETIHNPSFNN